MYVFQMSWYIYVSMMTSSMGNISALLAICAGNSPVPGEFSPQRSVMRSVDVFFDLRPNKRLSKQWWVWWFEMPLCPLWRHCNDVSRYEPDDPFFAVVLAELDQFIASVGNGLWADLYPVLGVSIHITYFGSSFIDTCMSKYPGNISERAIKNQWGSRKKTW